MLSLQREAARMSGTVGELAANEAQARGRITEIDIEILNLQSQRREEAITQLRDIQSRELELRERRRALLERMSRLDVTAPSRASSTTCGCSRAARSSGPPIRCSTSSRRTARW